MFKQTLNSIHTSLGETDLFFLFLSDLTFIVINLGVKWLTDLLPKHFLDTLLIFLFSHLSTTFSAF